MVYVDGSYNIKGNGAGIILIGPRGQKIEYALRLHFLVTNNVAKYGVLIFSLKLAREIGARSLKVYSDS